MKKADDKESTATVDPSKVKEEKMEVAGGKCWRGLWLIALNVTGEISNPSTRILKDLSFYSFFSVTLRVPPLYLGNRDPLVSKRPEKF